MTSASSDSAARPGPDRTREVLLAKDLAPDEARRILAAWGFEDAERADRALARMAGGPEERVVLAELLPDLFESLDMAGSPDRGLRNIERFFEAAGARLPLLRALAERPVRERLAILASQSQYFADILVREPRLLEWLGSQTEQPRRAELLAEVLEGLAPLEDEGRKLAALHRAKRRQLLACGFRDHVLGRPLERIAAEIALVAEVLIEAALESAAGHLRARFPDVRAGPLPFAVVALGKLGGAELNYSSDIDLLLVHDELFESPSASARELFDRLGRDLVHLLSTFGEEGALFRVDLRLRPEGAQGALSRGIAAYARYYESYGRTWERQALLKARVVAGDRELGGRLLSAIEPFVFRRYLEVPAIGEIQALKRRVEARGAAQPTRDVKEGPGGIRDIEFTVQFLELLYGGELAEVREPSTLGAIRKLESADCLAATDGAVMREAYVFLRTVEHRLQTLHSLQTHVLPASEPEQVDLARRLGYRGADARSRFLADLDRHGAAARAVLDRVLHALFPEAADRGEAALAAELVLDPAPPEAKVDRILGSFGIRDPARAMADIRRLVTEKSRFLRGSPRTRTYVASVLPALLRAVARHRDPDETLNRFERSTATLGGKAVFFQLLAEHPDTLDLFVRVIAESAFLTGLLTRSPGAFDELVDLLLTGEPVDVDRVLGRIRAAPGPTPEARARGVWLTTTLLVGFRDLGGRWNVANVLEALSALAEATLRALTPEDAGIAVLALGKLGGRELGYGSDLDLLAVYDEGEDAERAMRATQALVRTLEAAGLYSVDLRLRPEGTAAPLAVSVASLERYYRGGRAAVWERLAATKLRAVAGAGSLGACAPGRILDAIYASSPAVGLLAKETLAMRARVEAAAGGPLDLKRAAGGLVDLEFATGFLKLRHRGEPASIREPGVIGALHALARAGLLPRAAYVDLLTGYQFYRKLEARLRVAEGHAVSTVPDDPVARRALALGLGYVDTRRRTAEAALLDELAFHLRTVRARFAEVVRE
jgi:glutamate-ammonia-ligase adenylyltransferase